MFLFWMLYRMKVWVYKIEDEKDVGCVCLIGLYYSGEIFEGVVGYGFLIKVDGFDILC